jgi:hypothetical protein
MHDALLQQLWISGFAFPNCVYTPPVCFESRSVLLIASNVSGTLLRPKIRIGDRFGLAVSTFVHVPETTVNEDYRMMPGKHDVRSSGQIPAMQTKAQTRGVQKFPDL